MARSKEIADKMQSMDHDVPLHTNPPLTMSLGCVMLTCHTVLFVLSLLPFSWLVLLHHILCHVSSDQGTCKEGQ